MTSSPDPLSIFDENAMSPTSPQKTRASSITPRKPLINIAGNSAVQEFYISTPTRSKKQISPLDEKAASPWRIRVTLQAESTDERPTSLEMKEQTRITKIPLKGGDYSSPIEANKERGRSRKSLGSPIKRHGTPKPKSRRRKTASEIAEVEAIIISQPETTSPFAKRGDAFPKPRARKSRSPSKAKSQAELELQRESRGVRENGAWESSARKRSKSRKRRIEITPVKRVGSQEDEEGMSSSPIVISGQNNHVLDNVRDLPSCGDGNVDLDGDAEALQREEEAIVHETTSSSTDRDVYDADEHHKDPTINQADVSFRENTPDPTDEHYDFDTILESEGFSMVSVESLSSTGNLSKSPTETHGGVGLDLPTNLVRPTIERSPLREETIHGYSDISSFIPAIASPRKTSHQGGQAQEESVYGYSDISSFIPAAASPRKTSHVAVPLREQSIHGYSDISSFIPPAASPTKTSHLAVPKNAETPERSPSIQSGHGDSKVRSMPAQTLVSNRVSQLRKKPKAPATDHSPLQSAYRHSGISSAEPGYLNGTRQVILQKTPTTNSSPLMPAAPVAVQNIVSSRPLNDSPDGTPALDRTKRAGSALQDLQSSEERIIQYSDRLGSPFQVYNKSSPLLADEKTPAKNEAARTSLPVVDAEISLHDGRAAKRQELDAKIQTQSALSTRAGDKEESSVMVNRAGKHPKLPSSSPPKEKTLHSEIIYPQLPPIQLPSPADSHFDEVEGHHKSPKVDNTPVLPLNPMRHTKAVSPTPEVSLFENTIMAREAEWQREREAVSRQIEMANASQVIVIDSDSDSSGESQESESEIDVWTSTAARPKIKVEPQAKPFDPFLQPVTAAPEDKLSSSWRRSNKIDDADQTTTSDSESDLFWQPDQTKAVRRRQERKRLASHSPVETSRSHGDRPSVSKTIQVPMKEAPKSSGGNESLQGHNPEFKLGLPEDSKEAESSGDEALEGYEGIPNSCSSKHVIQDNFTSREHPLVLEPSSASSVDARGFSDGWSSQGLTFIDPLLLPVSEKTKTQTVATQTSVIASPVSKSRLHEQPATQSSKTSGTTWFSSLGSLFFTQTPAAIPWYNSPTCGLPPATRSDILASSPNVALSPTTPWTKAHQAALIPLYQSSWLFGAHIFAFNPSSASAKHISHPFSTPLGWSRTVTAQDSSVADAFMILLAARSKRFKNPINGSSPNTENQYNIPPDHPIDTRLVLHKCIEIWQDMVMNGDVVIDPEQEQGSGQRVGLRRAGDRPFKQGSWWDFEADRSQKAYFERKRVDWGGLPSWKAKGLI